MVDQHLNLPTFSFAPDRDGPNGYFSVGGIPPVNTTGKTASVSILTSKDTRSKPSINRPDYYYINIDGAIVGGTNRTNSSSFAPFVGFVETATTLTMLPSDKSEYSNTTIATSIARSFNPPATIAASTQLYQVPCNVTAPNSPSLLTV
ncbi:uncharacterized protein N7496_004133 [Penicillium cataractarum]|uniref:Peptidase A1 domain-containing protein n=1 Tax=Penicillium cataractarum TaxID=2100454 RepID=A0A9W9SPD6_9EURO|nr:uncharacterized protein N7496_004133 [Penicillium cataractarum]KAJ5381705.1 hypothetical protein N7496_004133 [Penicillium cataractarum]